MAVQVSCDTVTTIRKDIQAPVYDLWAPRFHNYLTHGLWSHNCGLGKSPMQLEWASHVVKHVKGRVLILAPLAVSEQTVREGQKFDIAVKHIRTSSEIADSPIVITNYERLHLLDSSMFAGIVLDESSILKGFDGVIRKQITDFAMRINFRLACTATPAPNDILEITNHAEFLSIMTGKEIIGLYFRNDGNTTHSWRLKRHAQSDFWRWLASWAVALRKPSDLGYDDDGFILPELKITQHVVDAVGGDTLFPMEARTMEERRRARALSINDRTDKAAQLANDNSRWLVWCNLNRESELLANKITDAVEVKGSDETEHKESSLKAFADGDIRVLVSKPTIAGFGLNFQNCHNMLFVGLSDSFEQYYQAIRREWRFGQTEPVNCHIIISETEGAVLKNIQRKERDASNMFTELVAHMSVYSLGATKKTEMEYSMDKKEGDRWTLYLGDSTEIIDKIAENSIGLSVFSPPFPGMYAYSNSSRDIGNCKSMDEMLNHFHFVIARDKLLRITKPGRSACVHLTQIPAFKGTDGYIGIKDFRGEVIRLMESEGWIYYGEVCIDKDPQVKAIRTKDRGLLFKTLAKDSSLLHPALADYLLQFQKPGENAEPIRAGVSEAYNNPNGWITSEEWIEWARPVWYGARPGFPGGIRETDVLEYRSGRSDDDEKHICPLQLGVIERAIKLWSNPGDTVFSPFAGVGSEGYMAIKLGRKFVGCELKRSYWDVAIGHLIAAEKVRETGGLFENVV